MSKADLRRRPARTGTTLVERILIRHEQVATVGEVNDLALAVTRRGRRR
jgi:hypothetical protein